MYALETGNEVVLEEEQNWKFRLSAYKDRLKGWASGDGGEFDPYKGLVQASQSGR